ncbi:hypothetical protein NQ814_05345 [Acinetobacter baumannii]|nr:hypothetical protein [Acinetobacter baumannii]
MNLSPVKFALFQPPGTQPDAQSIMHQHFHAMATFITEQVGAMRFDVASCCIWDGVFPLLTVLPSALVRRILSRT